MELAWYADLLELIPKCSTLWNSLSQKFWNSLMSPRQLYKCLQFKPGKTFLYIFHYCLRFSWQEKERKRKHKIHAIRRPDSVLCWNLYLTNCRCGIFDLLPSLTSYPSDIQLWVCHTESKILIVHLYKNMSDMKIMPVPQQQLNCVKLSCVGRVLCVNVSCLQMSVITERDSVWLGNSSQQKTVVCSQWSDVFIGDPGVEGIEGWIPQKHDPWGKQHWQNRFRGEKGEKYFFRDSTHPALN